MKRTFMVFCSALLFVVMAFSVGAQEMKKTPAAKPDKAKAVVPTSDADIQKCIQDKFANAPSMKDKAPTVSVSGGVATITGEAKNAGQKGSASRMAKACGAKEIKNEMTMPMKK